MIDPLQTSDEHVYATPVNWNQGDQVIVPPPKTENEVVARLNSDHEKVDFYLKSGSFNFAKFCLSIIK